MLEPGGRICLPHAATLDANRLDSLGLAVVNNVRLPSKFLTGHLPDANALDHCT